MRSIFLFIALAGLFACAPSGPVSVSPSPAVPTARTDAGGNILPPEVQEDVWQELRARPVRLPAFAAGAECPLTPTTQYPSGTGALAGVGPVYAVGNTIWYGPRRSDGLLAAKILWVAAPDYSGPALIRGRALNGSSAIYFSNSRQITELRFELDTRVRAAASDQGWRYLPSNVNVEDPGCFGFQLDGPGWTTIILMRAVAG